MSATDTGPWLVFERHGRAHAVAAELVRAVSVVEHRCPVPGAHSRVVGLATWRGGVVAVVEPGEERAGGTSTMVLVDTGGDTLGLAADSIRGWVDDRHGVPVLDLLRLNRDSRAGARISRTSIPAYREDSAHD